MNAEEHLIAALGYTSGIEWSRDDRSTADHVVYLLKKDPHRTCVVLSGDALKGLGDTDIKAHVVHRLRIALETLRNLEEIEHDEIQEACLVSQGWVPPAGWDNPLVSRLLAEMEANK